MGTVIRCRYTNKNQHGSARQLQEAGDHRRRKRGEDLRARSLREGGVRGQAYRPTIFHNTEKKIPHPKKEGEELKFQLWDTAGQEAYEEARRVCYSGTDVLLIAFSIVEPDSLANVENLGNNATSWAKEANLPALKDAPKLLVGLKADLKDDEAT